MTLVFVLLDRIQANPWQTRLGSPDPEYIQELALDIAANTLLQTPMGRWWTVAG
jgi:ParB-like chromosome segregation protein Spo0J